MKIEKDGAIHWESKLNTMTYSHGNSADIETTASAAIAFLRSGRYPGLSDKVMTYLIRSKDAHGTWHSTQATVLALKAMVVALGSTTEEVDGTITIAVDGKKVSKVMAPDVKAIQYLLNNRDPDRWKSTNRLEVTGPDGGALEYKDIRDREDELSAQRDKIMEALAKDAGSNATPE